MSPPPAAAFTVLLAEDHADTLGLYEMYFVEQGFVVIAATSAEAACAQLARRPVDAAVIDIALPGMDGFALARHIRASEPRRIPIVAVTGLPTRRELLDRARAAGIDAVLSKPCDPDTLVSTVRALTASRATGA